MAAKRHGRPRRGRPKEGDSVFLDIAEDERASKPARLLAQIAHGRNLAMKDLAKATKRDPAGKSLDPTALSRSFYAHNPHPETLKAICRALRLDPFTIEAANGPLSASSARTLSVRIRSECAKPPYSTQFVDPLAAQEHLTQLFELMSDELLGETLQQYLLLVAGAAEGSHRPPLSPEYALLHESLVGLGLPGLVSEDETLMSIFMGLAALDLAQAQLGLGRTDRQAVRDALGDRFEQIAALPGSAWLQVQLNSSLFLSLTESAVESMRERLKIWRKAMDKIEQQRASEEGAE